MKAPADWDHRHLLGLERRPPRYCADCGKATKGGKPYCTAHLDRMPYARQVAEAEAGALAEVARVAELVKAGKPGAPGVNLFGVVAQDVLAAVRVEPRTWRGIRRWATYLRGHPQPVVEAYLAVLLEDGQVGRVGARRGMDVWGLQKSTPERDCYPVPGE